MQVAVTAYLKRRAINGRVLIQSWPPQTFEKISEFLSERFSQPWIPKPQFRYPPLRFGSQHRIPKPHSFFLRHLSPKFVSQHQLCIKNPFSAMDIPPFRVPLHIPVVLLLYILSPYFSLVFLRAVEQRDLLGKFNSRTVVSVSLSLSLYLSLRLLRGSSFQILLLNGL